MRKQSIVNQGLQFFVALVGAAGVLLLFEIIASNTGLVALGLVLIMTALIGQVAVTLGGEEAKLLGSVPGEALKSEASAASFKKVS